MSTHHHQHNATTPIKQMLSRSYFSLPVPKILYYICLLLQNFISIQHIQIKKAKSMSFLKNSFLTFANIEFIQLVKVFFCVNSRCTGRRTNRKSLWNKLSGVISFSQKDTWHSSQI